LETRTVAVVGLSSDPNKPSNEVATHLQLSGYSVIPVNPNAERILGERAYASVSEIL
jgi:predicted CoA-binding protein